MTSLVTNTTRAGPGDLHPAPQTLPSSQASQELAASPPVECSSHMDDPSHDPRQETSFWGQALSPTQSEALAAGDGGLTRPSEPTLNTASQPTSHVDIRKRGKTYHSRFCRGVGDHFNDIRSRQNIWEVPVAVLQLFGLAA